MDLQAYLHAVARHWLVVLIAVVAGACAALFFGAQTTPQYTSSVTFYLSTPPAAAAGNALSADQVTQRRIVSYIELVKSERMASLVLSDTGLSGTPKSISRDISATTPPNTVLLNVTASGSSSQRADKIVAAVSKNLAPLIKTLEHGSPRTTTLVNIVSGPSTITTKVSPRRQLDLGVGLLLGVAVGVALAVARDRSGASDQAGLATSDPLSLARIPFDPAARKFPLIVNGQLHSARAEAYRQLRTMLQYIEDGQTPKVIAVTSAVSNQGRSSTAVNLAIAFAQAGRSTLLIEGDLRRPRAAQYLGVTATMGLTDILRDQVALEDALCSTDSPGLTLLPSGSMPVNPSELLNTAAMARLIDSLREKFDVVLMDTPPLLPVADAAVLSRLADAVIVTVRYRKLKDSELAAALSTLSAVNATVAGTVLTMIPKRDLADSRYRSHEKFTDPVTRRRTGLGKSTRSTVAGSTRQSLSRRTGEQKRYGTWSITNESL